MVTMIAIVLEIGGKAEAGTHEVVGLARFDQPHVDLLWHQGIAGIMDQKR